MLGTGEVPSTTLKYINTRPPYQDTRHILVGPHSTAN